MKFEIAAGAGAELGAPIADVAQEAIEVTVIAYANDQGIDVEDHVRAQLLGHGVRTSDGTIVELGRQIRAGETIRVGRSDKSSSL